MGGEERNGCLVLAKWRSAVFRAFVRQRVLRCAERHGVALAHGVLVRGHKTQTDLWISSRSRRGRHFEPGPLRSPCREVAASVRARSEFDMHVDAHASLPDAVSRMRFERA